MLSGLDFGTSNSAIGLSQSGQIELVSLFEDEKFIPSTLYTYDRNFICEYVDQQTSSATHDEYSRERRHQLNAAKRIRNFEGFEKDEAVVFFGKTALEHYIDSPEEGVFKKSPKSFLGATGLTSKQVHFFEDLVSAMMLNLKSAAEAQRQQELTQVVIGRPVNFQGVNSDQSNRQAIEIMTRSAERCGYKEVEFLFEPLAAGVDFESQLTKEKIVLVVDIGGGTTDCSMVKMGPSHIKKVDRSRDFLAHSGRRVGGNDIDIALAYHSLTPLLGRGSLKKKGIEVPSGPFWSAVSINDIGEQTNFNSRQLSESLLQLQRDAKHPEKLQRLIKLQQQKLNHRLVRSAELLKIQLSDSPSVVCDLDYIEAQLATKVSQQEFADAITKPTRAIEKLIQECISQAATTPDLVYITGGSAKSPTVRESVNRVLPEIEILDGDYYGSVAAGLTKWADKIWG